MILLFRDNLNNCSNSRLQKSAIARELVQATDAFSDLSRKRGIFLKICGQRDGENFDAQGNCTICNQSGNPDGFARVIVILPASRITRFSKHQLFYVMPDKFAVMDNICATACV